MPTETQQHPLADGSSVAISRNGNHQYWVGDGPKMKNVTGLIGHVDGDGFGAGMGWALKMARENGGDLEAPRRSTREATDIGTQLHEAIDHYIKTGGEIAEDPLFMAWHGEHKHRDFVESEQFIIHPELGYGGTADALSLEGQDVVIHDWKTVDPGSWNIYQDTLRRYKDWAQLAAYAHALEGMDSLWVPTSGYVTYVLRDGSEAVTVEADLELGMKLFKASRELFTLIQKAKE